MGSCCSGFFSAPKGSSRINNRAWEQVAKLAEEFLKALPDSIRDSMSVITNSQEVAQLAAKLLPKVNFISTGVRRLPSASKYVLLLGLARAQVCCTILLCAKSCISVDLLGPLPRCTFSNLELESVVCTH